MSTTIHLSRSSPARGNGLSAGSAPVTLGRLLGDRVMTRAFAEVVCAQVLGIAPLVNQELMRWRSRAAAIPGCDLRRTAQLTLAKRGNIEGAALFAVLAPARHRPAAVRSVVAFQTAYNYVDGLSELPSADPIANSRRLHEGLLQALGPGTVAGEIGGPLPDDGGYLAAILETCRRALAELPSYPSFAPAARRAARQIVEFQALNLGESQGGHGELRRWAAGATPAHSGLEWWETAVSAGSSLAVHALIAASANPGLEAGEACEILAVYFPWLGALHSLLDSLVDRREDSEAGRPCFLDYYPSTEHAAARLAFLASRGLDEAGRLPARNAHIAIATAMCSYYLSAPQCGTPEARAVRRALTRMIGLPLSGAILMFRAKRLSHAITDGSYS